MTLKFNPNLNYIHILLPIYFYILSNKISGRAEIVGDIFFFTNKLIHTGNMNWDLSPITVFRFFIKSFDSSSSLSFLELAMFPMYEISTLTMIDYGTQVYYKRHCVYINKNIVIFVFYSRKSGASI